MELIALRFKGGSLNGETVTIKGLWPPPGLIVLTGLNGFYKKVNQSTLTDEQLVEFPFMVRGAEYQFLTDEEVGSNPEEEAPDGGA